MQSRQKGKLEQKRERNFWFSEIQSLFSSLLTSPEQFFPNSRDLIVSKLIESTRAPAEYRD
jgi:hypothetical protein